MQKLRHASLFSGIGGFDIAAQWMGWENVMQCEIDPFCQTILKYYSPNAQLYGDIRDIDGTEWEGKIDILTGGFPCQPFSAAGRRRGTEDDRHLWPEMLRVIQEIRPTWIVGENVRGITNWSNGLVFEQVCTDLEDNEYEVQPFCIPACAVNAQHRRDRIWFIAYTDIGRSGRHKRKSTEKRAASCCATSCDATNTNSRRLKGQGIHKIGTDREEEHNASRRNKNDTDTINERLERAREKRKGHNGQSDRERSDKGAAWTENWIEVAARLCRVDDGLPRKLDGITISKWRRESLKAYGNAIVPHVAYQIFKSIDCV